VSLPVAAQAAFTCEACGAAAGEVVLLGGPQEGELSRSSPLTGTLTAFPRGAEFERLRRALEAGTPQAVFAADRELVPAYCPDCDRVYCEAHWIVWSERDDDEDFFWIDCIRGRCPQGHERMLED
jgi:hypothetical protein